MMKKSNIFRRLILRKDNFVIPEIELPGIYGILNTVNGKMYVGSAINLKFRKIKTYIILFLLYLKFSQI